MGKTPSTAGKGDRPRPVKGDTFRANWDSIFRKASSVQSIWDTTMNPALNAQRKPLIGCAADRDGECHHADCPQIRDNEPETTGRHCPLDRYEEED